MHSSMVCTFTVSDVGGGECAMLTCCFEHRAVLESWKVSCLSEELVKL